MEDAPQEITPEPSESAERLTSGANSTSPQDPDTRRLILETARQRFMTYGFSKVTMEEIAQELSMSKKTLYKHFSNKTDLLQAVARELMAEAQGKVEAAFQDPTLPFIQKLERVMAEVGVQTSRISHQIVADISRNVPTVWQEVQAFRMRRIQNFGGLIREGMAQGYLRGDLDDELVMKIYMGAISGIMDPTSFAEARYTPKQGLATLIAVLFEGMLTEKGREEKARIDTVIQRLQDQ